MLTGPCGVAPGDGVLVCCSGGVDSMVLLELLHRAAPGLNLDLGVIHVEHGLRGEASRRDAEFVEGECRRRGLPCLRRDLHLDPAAPNLEERARTGRYAAIHACLEEGGYAHAATGHNLDDQAETVLYRLVRGSGIRGAGGMSRRTPGGIVRPLLGMSRAEIEAWAEKVGVMHVEDATNASLDPVRNRLRHEVLPLLAGINPRVNTSLARFAGIARREGDYIADLAADLAADALTHDWGLLRAFDLKTLQEAHEVLLRRLVIEVVSEMLGAPRGIDALQVEQVLDVVNGRQRAHTLKRRLRISREGRFLVCAPAVAGPYYELSLEGAGEYPVDDTGRSVNVAGAFGPADGLVLRSALPGDRLGSRKVVRLLAEAGIPPWLRSVWPVISQGETLLAVADIKVAGGDLIKECFLTP